MYIATKFDGKKSFIASKMIAGRLGEKAFRHEASDPQTPYVGDDSGCGNCPRARAICLIRRVILSRGQTAKDLAFCRAFP